MSSQSRNWRISDLRPGCGRHAVSMQVCASVHYRCCTGVQVYRCTGVQVFRGSGVQVFRCTGVQVYRCTGEQARLYLEEEILLIQPQACHDVTEEPEFLGDWVGLLARVSTALWPAAGRGMSGVGR